MRSHPRSTGPQASVRQCWSSERLRQQLSDVIDNLEFEDVEDMATDHIINTFNFSDLDFPKKKETMPSVGMRTQPVSFVSNTDEEGKKYKNKCKCKKCGDIIESRHRHDFVRCSCGSIFTEGGLDYIRRGGALEDIEDITEEIDEEKTNGSS